MGKIWTALYYGFLSPRTLAPLFVSGLAGYHAIAERELLMSDWWSFGTVILFLVAGVVSWLQIAIHNWKADKLEDKRDAQYIDLKQQFLAVQPAPQPTRIEDISKWSNDVLRQMVEKLSDNLREKEGEYHKAFYDHMDRFHSKGLNGFLAQQNTDFQRTILPDALAIRDELLTRLPGYSTGFEMAAIDFGNMAGASPLNDAAGAFEKMARELK